MTAAFAPLPGDPVAVRRASRDYEAVAETISTAAARLRQIADQRAQDSEAVQAVATKARDVAHKVSRAHGRYQQVGRALGAYAVRLDTAQSAAAAAARAGRAASEEYATAGARVAAATAALESATPDTLDARTRELEDARGDRDVARRAVDVARADAERAIETRDRAAETAARAIRAALDDGLDDGWWQDWGKALVTMVAAVADVVSNIAGILAFVLCWLPGASEFLALVALLAAGLKLLMDVVLALDGDVAWSDVAWDAAGLVPGGAGKGVGAMARTTTGAAAGTARREAERLLRGPRSARPQGFPGPRVNRQDALRTLLGDTGASMSRAEARGLVHGVSRRQAIKDAINPGVERRAMREGRELRRNTSFRDWWHAQPGARFAVRALGDRELGRHMTAVREIAPELLAVSSSTKTAVVRAHRWRVAAVVTYAGGATESALGAQDVTDGLAGDGYAPGVVHAVQSVFGGHGDGSARSALRLHGENR